MAQKHRFLIAAALVALLAPTVSGQRPTAVRPGALTIDEATALTQGWALLAQGLVQDAAAHAARIMTANPRSAAALVLAVEVEIARGGAMAGLSEYERWLGARALEEPGVLRRLAQATLREIGAQQGSPDRIDALVALAAEGDAEARSSLAGKPADAGGAGTRALASMGDPQAVRTLVAHMKTTREARVEIIEALGKSGSRTAVDDLVPLLGDPLPEVRGAVAEAVGRLGGPETIGRIKALLNDQSGFVRTRAAAALYGLGDDAGLPVLQELAASESPKARLAAAEAMATRPDGSWLTVVRDLTGAEEPETRLAAARLIAPHDPELARSVFSQLQQGENLALREAASRSAAEMAMPTELAALRALLRSDDGLTKVKAAKAILALTR